jgi:hypothetical protein
MVSAGGSYYSYPQGGYSSDTSRATLMSDYYTAHQQMPGQQRKVSERMRNNNCRKGYVVAESDTSGL